MPATTSSDRRQRIRRLSLASNLYALLCLPLMLWQAWRINYHVLRLAEAADTAGLVTVPEATGSPLRLLVLGESTAVGVGSDSNDNALAGHLARQLSNRLQQTVHWRVTGQNGYRVNQTRKLLCPRVSHDSADVVVLVHGFNDTVGWTSAGHWQMEIRRVVEHLRGSPGSPRIILSGIPPFRHFAALPQPTRGILGLRADLLEMAADELAERMYGLVHVKLEPLPGAEYYCIDGFHPSHRGYAIWAERLADVLCNGDNRSLRHERTCPGHAARP